MKKASSNEDIKIAFFYELEQAKNDLDIALQSFDSAPMDLVDYYSYRIKAAEAKYDYLLKRSKDMNISKF